FLWHKGHPQEPPGPLQDGRIARTQERSAGGQKRPAAAPAGARQKARTADPPPVKPAPRDEKKRADAEARKRERASRARQAEIDALETRIAECEQAIRD